MKADDVTATLEDCSGGLRLRHARGCTGLACSPTMAAVTSPAIWPTGSKTKGMDHVRGAPNHPQTQGKIERWHQTLKNRILLENYYLPGALKRRSMRSSITTITALPREPGNLTPADVYFGRGQTILDKSVSGH
jgi:putative transposase